ncbi:MAG TPA: phosphotransferase family protein [Porticoccaceae bacterium]|nr:phosphotransferase family protein [Porticoccaceae bacterium]
MKAHTPIQALRDRPTTAWIAQSRARFPVEPAIDAVFTRKLKKRVETPEHSMDFSALPERLRAFLAQATGQPELRVTDVQRLAGGASKEQFSFQLHWRPDGGSEQVTRRMMLRMDPSEAIVETHRQREWEVLRAMRGLVPVPEALWLDPEGEALGRPALIAGFLEGTVRPPGADRMSGVGMYFEPALRAALQDEFIAILARIHRLDWRRCALPSFAAPEPGTTQAVDWALGLWDRAWYEDTLDAHPIMARAALWLREHRPVVQQPVLVHGDYRSGNFMYDDQLRINAIFDWELAYLGDYHDDLAWASLALFGCPDENGTPLASSLLPVEDFLRKYEQASGNPVDRQRLFYYQVFSYYKISVIAMATSLRIAHGRRTHLDAMMNFASGLGYIGISELNRLLDRA